MDSYSDVRSISLNALLPLLGYTDFRKRNGKEEWSGPCPIHGGKSNSFSFTDRVFHCFSCDVKGSGAIDFLMALKKVNFRQAVEELRALHVPTEEAENPPIELNYEKYYVRSEWLEARVPKDILELYGVGVYSNPARKSRYTNQVMFPVYRGDGAKVGYLSMPAEDGAEVSLPPIKRQEIFGLHQLGVQGPAGQVQTRPLGRGSRLPLGIVVDSPLKVLELRSRGFYGVFPMALSPVILGRLYEQFERVLFLNPVQPIEATEKAWIRILRIDSPALESLEACLGALPV